MGESGPKRQAVVLFNLGGPDSLEAVRPFLFNLFLDPAIIRVPQPFRLLIAKLISWRRARQAKEIYRAIGGHSPLLEETRKQAAALEAVLSKDGNVRVFVAMRYWHPMARSTAREVAAFGPDEVILVPLYPQYSTTTTASSLKDWGQAAAAAGLAAPTRAVCCYPTSPDLIAAHVDRILEKFGKTGRGTLPRLLFSAHGLPEKIVRDGDPYAWQIEATVAAIMSKIRKQLSAEDIDHAICYQSRVGPLKWIEPSTEQEIVRAGKEGRALLVVPVAFVSEHSETLHELDIRYAELARREGVPAFDRVEALRTHEKFIEALARLVQEVIGGGQALSSGQGDRCCPEAYKGCPMKIGEL